MPTLLALLLLLLSHVLLSRAGAESIDAYIPATYKTLFDQYNAVIFGDASLARAAVRGALAVMGTADLADFDVAATGTCDKDARSLVVAGTLTARAGSVHNGYIVVGRRSTIDNTVRRTCTARTEQYDPARNGDIEFSEKRANVLRETGDLCVTEPGGEVKNVNETLQFVPGEAGFSCYTFFKVHTDDLRLAKKWVYAGDDPERNVVIVVNGLKVDFREFQMEGFNARRTLLVFCSVYGSYGLYNAKLHGSVLAPASTFTTMSAIINGSLILGSLRGSFATLNTQYQTC